MKQGERINTHRFNSHDRNVQAARLAAYILPDLPKPKAELNNGEFNNIDLIKNPSFDRKLTQFRNSYKTFKNALLNTPNQSITEKYLEAAKKMYELIQEIRLILEKNTNNQLLSKLENYIQDLVDLLLDSDQSQNPDSIEIVQQIVIAQNLPEISRALLKVEQLNYQDSFITDLEADVIFIQQLAQKTIQHYNNKSFIEVNLSATQNTEIQFFSLLKNQVNELGYQKYAFTSILKWLDTQKEDQIENIIQNPEITNQIYNFAKSDYQRHGYYNFESPSNTESQQIFNEYSDSYFDRLIDSNQSNLKYLASEINFDFKELDRFETKTSKLIYIISKLHQAYGQKLWNLLGLKLKIFYDFPKSQKINTSYCELLRISAQKLFPENIEKAINAINQILLNPSQNLISHYWENEAYKTHFTERFFKTFILKMHRLLIGEPESETNFTKCLANLREVINAELSYLKKPYDHRDYKIEVIHDGNSRHKIVVAIKTPVIDRISDILGIDFIELNYNENVKATITEIEKIDLSDYIEFPEQETGFIEAEYEEYEEVQQIESYDLYTQDFYENENVIIPETKNDFYILKNKLKQVVVAAQILSPNERLKLVQSLKNLVRDLTYDTYYKKSKLQNLSLYFTDELYTAINDIKNIEASSNFIDLNKPCYYGQAKLLNAWAIIEKTLPKTIRPGKIINTAESNRIGNNTEILVSKQMDDLPGQIFTFRSPPFSSLDRHGLDLFCVQAITPSELTQSELLFAWLFARILSVNFNSSDTAFHLENVFHAAKKSIITQINNTNQPIDILESLDPHSTKIYAIYDYSLKIYPKFDPKKIKPDIKAISIVDKNETDVINFLKAIYFTQFEHYFLTYFKVAGVQVKTGIRSFTETIQKFPKTPAIFTPSDPNTFIVDQEKVKFGIEALYQGD